LCSLFSFWAVFIGTTFREAKTFLFTWFLTNLSPKLPEIVAKSFLLSQPKHRWCATKHAFSSAYRKVLGSQSDTEVGNSEVGLNDDNQYLLLLIYSRLLELNYIYLYI